MLRTSVNKGKNKQYSEEQLNNALLQVVEGQLTIRKASARYKIPLGTLWNKFHGRHFKSVGRPKVFPSDIEDELVELINICGDWYFPLSYIHVRQFVKHLIKTNDIFDNSFVDGVTPGPDWMSGFLKRHSDKIRVRIAASINRNRAEVSPEDINKCFDELAITIKDVPATNIFNLDETDIRDETGKQKLLFRRGTKYPVNVENTSKSCTTLLVCGSASGILLPPCFIYKNINENVYRQWTSNGPQGLPFCAERCCAAGSMYQSTSSGWIDADSFTTWFRDSFLPHADGLPRRKVVLSDNLASHFTPEEIKLCKDHNVSMAYFVANSTNISQPLDAAFFRAMKEAWRRTLREFKTNHSRVKGNPKTVFPELVKQCFENMDVIIINKKKMENWIVHNLQSGFSTCGIVPLDRKQVLKKITQKISKDRMEGELFAFLKEKRFKNKPIIVRRLRKSDKIIAGRNVVHHSSESEEVDNPEIVSVSAIPSTAAGPSTETPILSKEKTNKQPKKRILNRPVSGNEKKRRTVKDVTDPLPNTNENNPTEDIYTTLLQRKSYFLVNKPVSSDKQLTVNPSDFVLAKYITDERGTVRHFVGRVQLVCGSKVTIRFLRSYMGRKDVFVFPPIEDEDTVSKKSIVAVLPAPRIARDKHQFPFDVFKCVL